MSKPTTQALKCLKHLILYLSETAARVARATLLPYTSVGTRLITRLNGSVDTEITREAGHVVEAYSDSDWGSLKTPEKARRKSTSSGIIVLNGIQVLSFSRTQKATASSSCEAELYALSGTCGEAILVGRLFEFLTEKPVSVEVRCDSSSARQWTQRRGVGRLKHVDVRLCQLQDWVRDNIVKLGTVKTALNVADLNTTKLSCARRAFLLYHLSQVEYFEGEEIVRTGEDEYDKYEQEKRLKEYVGGNPVKNLIRLIQVFSVIRPSTASWIKGSPVAVETGEASGNSHTMERLDITYILLVIAVAVLIVPRILEAWKRITKLIARMSTVGMVKIHSGSRNKVFHKETCRYVQGQPRTGMFYYLSSEEAREQGYRPCYICWPETPRKVVSGSSFGRGRNKMDKDLVVSSSDESWEVTEEENEVCSKVCYWCEQRKCSRKKVGHVWCSCESCIREYAAEKWRATYDKTPDEGATGDHSWNQSYAGGSTEGQSGTRMQGKGSLRKRGTASRGRAAISNGRNDRPRNGIRTRKIAGNPRRHV